MPESPRSTVTIRIEFEAREKLRSLSKRYDLTQNDILTILFDMCDQHDLLRKDWQDRLTAALERGQREIEALAYYEDPNKCPAIAKGSEKYKCVWGREGKPPQIRVLEADFQASLEVCKKCKVTLQIMQEAEGLRSKVDQLTNQLERKAKESFKVPICHKGATLNENATEFSNCPKYRGENVSVESFCKKYSRGLPCALYAERVIAVGDGKSESGSKPNR
jgi:hypothetical protein